MKNKKLPLHESGNIFILDKDTLILKKIGQPLKVKEKSALIKYCNDNSVKFIQFKNLDSQQDETITISKFLEYSDKNFLEYLQDSNNSINPEYDRFIQDSPSMKLRREFGLI